MHSLSACALYAHATHTQPLSHALHALLLLSFLCLSLCVQVLANLDKSKYAVPDDWNYEGARELFRNPEVRDPTTIDVRTSCYACAHVA
jgi:hypothetical protein